jgi:hypothetical protein
MAKCSVEDMWALESPPEVDQRDEYLLRKWVETVAKKALAEQVPVMWLYWPYGLLATTDEEMLIRGHVDEIWQGLRKLESWRTRLNLRPGKVKHHERERYSAIVWGRK